ncbi:MAG: hypothetical protein U0531_02060 [Dehalococcoidia bacterium]
MNPATVYLLYDNDGATLVYVGPDEEAFERESRALAPRYAGSLLGRRQAGRAEHWVIRAFFHKEPSPEFIHTRRRFPYNAVWEPSAGSSRDAAP